MAKKDHTVSRLDAAEILDVSVRTLDRYAKGKKISSMRRGRSLFYDEDELLAFKARLMAEQQREDLKKAKRQEQPQPQKHIPERESIRMEPAREQNFVEVEEAQIVEQQGSVGQQTSDIDRGFAEIRDTLLRRSPEEGIFKALYEKTDEELKIAQQKLEMANYQVGKLEAQVRSMVPMLEFKRQKQQVLELEDKNKRQKGAVKDLQKQLEMEQFVKKLYAGFLYFMVGLLPLLLILRLVG